MSDEKPMNEAGREFDIVEANKQSRMLVADLLMTEGLKETDENGEEKITENKMFLAVKPQMNPDGSMVLVCMTKPNSDEVIVHTILSGYMKTEELFNPEPEEKSNLVDLDGSPLGSNDTSKIIGLDGKDLN